MSRRDTTQEGLNQDAPDPFHQVPNYPTGPQRPGGLPSPPPQEYNRPWRPGRSDQPDQNLTFDEQGYPVVNGKPIGRPGADYGLDYQFVAEREAERRRNSLWSDAQNSLRQGLDLFQSYRPGGSAALASGMFQQSSSLYGTQALNTEAPDMLQEYREKRLADADRERRRATKFSQNLALAQFAMNPAGLLNQGTTPQSQNQPQNTPSEAPAPAAPGQTPSGGSVPVGNAASAPGAAQAGSAVLPAGAGGGGLGGQNGIYSAPGQDTGSDVSKVMRAGGSGGGTTVDGGFGAGGSPGGQVGAGGSRARAAGGGMGGAGGGGAGGGLGGPPIQTYTGPEAATRAQMVAPGSTELATSSWAGDALRTESVALRVTAARSSLLAAVGNGAAGAGVGSGVGSAALLI